MKGLPGRSRMKGVQIVADQDNRGYGAADIRSEARGPHWIAWVAQADGTAVDSIVLVGQTRAEAEDRARRWAERRAPRS